MTFGQKLKHLRQSKKLSQEQLAKKLGIKRSTYSRYEIDDNQADYETLNRIASFFSVTVDWLIGHAEHPTETEDEFLERMIKEGTLAFHDYEGLSEEDIETVKNEIKKEMRKQVEYMVWRKIQEKK